MAPALTSERTVLRPFVERDTHQLLRLFRDPAIRRYLLDDALVSADWVHDEIGASTARFAKSGTGLWSVRLAAQATIIGFVGFREFFDPPQLQLIYGLLPDHWGRGLATEVAARIRDHAFLELGFSEVAAAIDRQNEASGRVLERLGMRQERTTHEGAGGTAFYLLDRPSWAGLSLRRGTAPMKSHGPRDMMAAVTGSLRERTGRTLQQWVATVRDSGIDPLDQKTVRRWLKTEHGVLQNSQWAIADAAARAAGWAPPTTLAYVDQQYAGPKMSLRPIFERIRETVEAFGDDVGMEGRSTYIPFVRRRQFLAVAAATRARVDLGLRYTDAPASALLVPAQAPGQATHKLSLTTVDEITPEVERLLQVAYSQNG